MARPGTKSQVRACSLAELEAAGRLVVKRGPRQILLLATPAGVYACNNRCPHEGYPLAVGTLDKGCVLTCNWHNWKFDLASGETLVGGDRLRRFPVAVRDGEVWLDLAEPPPAERIARALADLRQAFDDYDYERMARELARLERAGAAPHAALVRALEWSHDRLEFGMSHAQAAAAEWLRLGGRRARSAPKRLAVRLEAVSHLAWDVRREPAYPYPAGADPFAPEALVAAIEAEDEAGAVRQARGALSSGHGFAPLEAPLTRAALAHYQDFGHALIYVYKARLLAEQVGAAAAETVVLPLVRMLIYCRREDLIPEFRHYAPALAAWDGGGGARPAAEDFRGLTVKRALALAVRASGDPAALYQALLGAAAWNFLHFDLALERQSDNPVSRNVGWLDVTHAVTFANAVRVQCGRHPELWPQGLLQLACFVGRNAGFVDAAVDARRWRVAEPRRFLDAALDGLFDHGQREHIVAAHLLKTLMAVDEELRAAPEAPWVPTLLAAVNRFLNSPLRRRHVARTAKQALAFVAQES